MTATVLVVDDDDAFRGLVMDILRPEGHRLLEARHAEEALAIVSRQGKVDLVLTDQRMPGMDGLELVRRLRALAEPPAILLMTAYGTIPQAVEAIRLGADDYLTKPLESPQALRNQVRRLVGILAPGAGESEFLTRDPATLEVLALADRAAATDATVMILGESGTGKELLARRIHRASRRSAGPFVAVNSAALPEELAESELFGHERGAFTGAASRRHGHFEQARGGTLFLDEIGELSDRVQAKLLRVLEERRLKRLGGEQIVEVDIRLVTATHRDLSEAVREGRFRDDLFYRLNVVSLHLPPLRERSADLELLMEKLLVHLARDLGVAPKTVSEEALQALRRHDWPGNVRELKNALQRSLVAAPGDVVELSHLPPLTARSAAGEGAAEKPSLSLRKRERRAILEALEKTSGHREQAAELLGISVRTLYSRLTEYGIR